MEIKKTANEEIKRVNRTSIYQLLRHNAALSRQDIVMMLRLSLPTVTQNLSEMEEEGLVYASGSIGNTGGRRAKTYSTVDNAQIAVGLDITRHHITGVAIDLAGRVISQERVRVNFERSDPYYRRIGTVVEKIIADTGLDKERVLGVGIAVPGLVSGEGQMVYYGKALDLKDLPCNEIAAHIPFPTRLVHDSSAAGFAEIWIGGSMQNAFYITLNDSIGGALIIDGELFEGDTFRSAEVGHIRIVPHGKGCYCGGLGCMDAYCSASNLTNLSNGNIHDFFELLQAGDKKAREVWNEYLFYLASAINNVRMLIDCPIILGGRVGMYMDSHIDELRKIAAEMDPFEEACNYIHVCKYKNEATATGAALMYVVPFLESI